MFFKNCKYKFSLIIILLLILNRGIGQDPEFSQFYSNKLYLNPAFAGISDNAGLTVHFRDQRIQSSSVSNVVNASYNQYFEPVKGGIGIQIINDNQGSFINKLQFDGIYTYYLQAGNELFFNAGIQASVFQKNKKLSGLTLPGDFDVLGENLNTSRNYIYPDQKGQLNFDFSTGFVGYYKSSYFGLAVHHLTRPNELDRSFSFVYADEDENFRLKRKYTFHYGTMIKIFKHGLVKEKYSISPNIVYQYQSSHRINYGLYFLYQNITFGAWIKQAFPLYFETAVFLIGFEMPGYGFSYSYDFKLPKSGALLNMCAHEVTFNVNFEYKYKKKIKAIKCPKF